MNWDLAPPVQTLQNRKKLKIEKIKKAENCFLKKIHIFLARGI
jgi:hypothetical protein